MEDRRASRLPRPAFNNGKALADKVRQCRLHCVLSKSMACQKQRMHPVLQPVNTLPPAPAGPSAAIDRKRKAAGLGTIPESKRPARPATSAPNAPPAPAASVGPAPSFVSEGANAKPAATGPAPGEETFDDIRARTGASEADILSKKMAFKKGMRPEKKIEEMVPMVKELRWGLGRMPCTLRGCALRMLHSAATSH